MNYLAIDYGTKRIGLAVSISGIISPLEVIANNTEAMGRIRQVITSYGVHKVYVGISEGKFADITRQFATKLQGMLELPVETVEEAVSTIEADRIYRSNGGKQKHYKKRIDSISAAVILNRTQHD